MKAALKLSFLLISPLCAQSAGWGTGSSYGETRYMSYLSDGTADTGQINWNLGYFNDGFTATADNWAQWSTNFNTVDTAVNQDDVTLGNRWGVSSNYTPVADAAVGQQVWVFAYNDLSLFGTDSGEALLYSDGQLFPGANTISVDIFDDDDTNDDNASVVWGRVDRAYSAEGGLLEGDGVFSNPLADSTSVAGGTFETQLGTWESIPEPSTSLLAALGGISLLARRRRLA